MGEDALVEARRRAERAVDGMDEGPLKIAAFQTILSKLLADTGPAAEVQRTPAKAPPSTGKRAGTLTGRVLGIRS